MRKLIVCLLVLVVSSASWAIYRPDRAIRVATGYVAHTVCSQSFVSGLDPQTTFSEAIDREGIRRLRLVLGYRLDAPPGPSMSPLWGCSAAVPIFMRALVAS